MKKLALLLVLALLIGPLVRLVTMGLLGGALGEKGATFAAVAVAIGLLAIGLLAWRNLDGGSPKSRKREPLERPAEPEIIWPTLTPPDERPASPTARAGASHSPAVPSGLRWWPALVALLLCLALAMVVVGPATKVPRTSPSWRPDKRVSDEIEQNVAQAGLTSSDIEFGDWKPCVDFAQVTDVSCLSRPVYWQGEEVGILIDSPSAEKPEARQRFTWLGRPHSPWPKLPWEPRSAAPR